MTDNRLAGIALIAGQLGLILTLALHPSGKITPGEVDAMVRKLLAVHSIALASMPLMILGALGLARALWPAPNRLSVTGFVIYTFGIVALLSGVVIDGLVMPRILPHLADAAQAAAAQAHGATPATASGDTWRTLMKYNGFLDMAFVQVSMIATAAAIAVWSCAMIFGKLLNRGTGFYGQILGVLVVAGLISGAFAAEHAIYTVVFGQASWFIAVGSQLCVRPVPGEASPA